MKFYFSGIASQNELDLLIQAGISNILMDTHQHANINPYSIPEDVGIAIDSGAYRDFKLGIPRNTTYQSQAHLYRRQVSQWRYTDYDFFVAYDVIGQPARSHQIWTSTFQHWHAPACIPVWHGKAGHTQRQLDEYLFNSEIVGLGGLVMLLRGGEGQTDKKIKQKLNKQRDRTINWIGELAAKYPKRFHLFGSSSPNAINDLAGVLYSADSSIWLRGRKYGKVLFQHETHGRFTQAHQQYLPDYKEMTPDELCIASARNIEQFCLQTDALNIRLTT